MNNETKKPHSPLHSFDAQVWAKCFMENFGHRLLDIDESLMIAWFANALMRGYDENGWKYQERIEKLKNMVDIQTSDGNWNYSPYMQGMANGMLLMLATIRADEGEVPFLAPPDKWLCDKRPSLWFRVKRRLGFSGVDSTGGVSGA